jgi:hypothetical protein
MNRERDPWGHVSTKRELGSPGWTQTKQQVLP